MKRTIVEEYNDDGRLVRKTVTEEGAPYDYTYYYGPYWSVCSCGTSAICPIHPRTWTVTTTDTGGGISQSPNTIIRAYNNVGAD